MTAGKTNLMPLTAIPPNIENTMNLRPLSMNSFQKRSDNESGQALIELYFCFVLFFFIAVLTFESSIVFHNFNVVNNALKQSVWRACMGASNEDIIQALTDADTQMARSAFFKHRVSDWGLYVWVPTASGHINIAPTSTSKDANFSGGSSNMAAYIYRAQDNDIRVGVKYHVSFTSPFFGSTPVFSIPVNLTESMAVIARNDEDRDGLVDLYEPELFQALLGEAWTPLSHRDNGVPDMANTDIDSDGIADSNEVGTALFDFDNDGWLDRHDPDTNSIRHPVFGGNKVTIP